MTKNFLGKAINLIFFMLFSWIFINVILNNQQDFNIYNLIIIIFFVVLFLMLLILINNSLEKYCANLSGRKKILILCTMVCIMGIFQLVLGYYLRVTPSWDFGNVHDSAISLVTTGKVEDSNYFLNFRNNTGALLILSFIYKIASLFGINNFVLVGIIFNTIVIDISLILMFFITEKLLSTAKAFLAFFIAMLTTPLYTYVPIFYTDTLSMVFPVLILYIFILTYDIKSKLKKCSLYFLIGVIAFIGAQVKLTAMFILISICIELFLNENIKDYGVKLGTMLVAFIIALQIFNGAVNSSRIFDFKMEEKSPTPFTHWIMMGLKNRGGWNWDDYLITYGYATREERIYANLVVAGNRIVDYGFSGYFKFLTTKASWTWGDGTYFSPVKLRRKPVNDSILSEIFLEGKYFKIYSCFSQVIHITTLFLILMYSLFSINTKRNNYINIVKTTMLGLIVFLLIWETRSRYIVNYIPLFILIAVAGIDDVKECFNKDNFLVKSNK